jgi:hypothetical protein
MTPKKSNPIIGGLSRIAGTIAAWIEGFINWLVSTRIILWLDTLADWIRKFLAVAHLVRFSFWISILGSMALFATSQSLEILRVIAEDSEHRPRALPLFTISALTLSLMSWYWARALIYRFQPGTLDLPRRQPEAIAARWMPRVCGLIPFVGIGYALWQAAHPPGVNPHDEGYRWLMNLFWLDLAEGLVVGVGLHYRHTVANSLRSRFPTLWPEHVKSKGASGLTDLPAITWVVLLITVLVSIILFIVFTTSTGQVRVSGWFGPASLVLLAIAAWIAFGSFFVIYFGKLVKLPILTPLLLLAFLFSYFDLNDNHEIRSFNQPIQNAPQDFDKAFQAWWDARADKDSYKDRPYPVFIISAEGGGIKAGYFSAAMLTAIQDRSPAFAQHVFAISGVSGGSLGAAVYAGLAQRCTNNLPLDKQPEARPLASEGSKAGPLQNSADAVLKDDYLSPLLSALLYPDLVQRFLPYPINRWDRARALEERFETSWTMHASCDGTTATGGNEFSQPFYDFFHDFPRSSTPAMFFNTTNVETGERMFVTNLLPRNAGFNQLSALADVNNSFNPPFSSAACLSARFPAVTPAGFVGADGRKFRYVDGGYYENSGTATAYNILMSLQLNGQNVYDALMRPRSDQKMPIIPIIIRIGFPIPKSRNVKDEIKDSSSEERAKYKGPGLNEIMSPIKTLLNTRGARGNDAVRQIQTAMQNLKTAPGMDQCPGQFGCMFNFELSEEQVKLPLGWLLSNKSRCDIQRQVGYLSESCGHRQTDPNAANQQQLQAIISLLTKKP